MPRQPTRHKKLPPPASMGHAVERVQAGVVKMFDRGDGYGVDWPIIAQVLLQAGLTVARDHDDPGMASVLRYAAAEAHDLSIGNEPSGLEAPLPFLPAPSGVDNTAMRPSRAPSPRLKP